MAGDLSKLKPENEIGTSIKKRNDNKTISDGGITVDFSIIKVHTSN